MATLPKSIRVGYRDYVVEDWPVAEASAEGAYGDCDKANGRIRVCIGHGDAVAGEVSIHETLHACVEAGSLSCKEGEERVVTVLAKQLAQVIRDNPDLVRYWQGGAREALTRPSIVSMNG